jgi:hypothetical protein
MPDNYSASASFTVRRIRHSDSLYLTLENNGKPLFQSFDKQTGVPSPDWTQAANQPVLTPHATSLKDAAVALSHHSWTYNGVALVFNGATSGGYTADSTGKFALNPTTGALKIIGNLASAINTGNDTLEYSCVATVNGDEYNLFASADIVIQIGGASSYYGWVDASSLQLDSDTATVNLVPHLWLSGNEVQNFYVKWYKGSTVFAEKAAAATKNITRADVDGAATFIAEFYLNSSDSNYVSRYGVTILDKLDSIMLVPYIDSVNKDIDTGKPVTVRARVVKGKDRTVIIPVNPTWLFEAYNPNTWELLKTSSTDSIVVSVTESDDADGTLHDVRVECQCSFASFTSN